MTGIARGQHGRDGEAVVDLPVRQGCLVEESKLLSGHVGAPQVLHVPVLRVPRHGLNRLLQGFFRDVVGPVDIAQVRVETHRGVMDALHQMERGPAIVDQTVLVHLDRDLDAVIGRQRRDRGKGSRGPLEVCLRGVAAGAP